jgi:hypothetical protein
MTDLEYLDTLVGRVKRLISAAVVSGTYTDNDLTYYIQDANALIDMDYSEFGVYTVGVSTGITPQPTATDSMLLSLKAAELAYTAILHESIADAVMVRAGSITLDTSKSLNALTEAINNMRLAYRNTIDALIINGSAGALTGGYRLDNYKERDTDTEVSDSLI